MAKRAAPSSRSRARHAAMQALYQWQLTGQNPADIETQFVTGRDLGNADPTLFKTLLNEIPTVCADLDASLAPLLDRPLEQLDPVELTILRIGAFELEQRREIPWRVVINEAVELAKLFGAEQSHRYINGILDKLARIARPEA